MHIAQMLIIHKNPCICLFPPNCNFAIFGNLNHLSFRRSLNYFKSEDFIQKVGLELI